MKAQCFACFACESLCCRWAAGVASKRCISWHICFLNGPHVMCSQSVSSLLQYNICYNNYSHQISSDTTQAQFQCKLFKSMHASSSRAYIYFSKEAGSLQHQVICPSSTLSSLSLCPCLFCLSFTCSVIIDSLCTAPPAHGGSPCRGKDVCI